jgi:hypothetical protein
LVRARPHSRAGALSQRTQPPHPPDARRKLKAKIDNFDRAIDHALESYLAENVRGDQLREWLDEYVRLFSKGELEIRRAAADRRARNTRIGSRVVDRLALSTKSRIDDFVAKRIHESWDDDLTPLFRSKPRERTDRGGEDYDAVVGDGLKAVPTR